MTNYFVQTFVGPNGADGTTITGLDGGGDIVGNTVDSGGFLDNHGAETVISPAGQKSNIVAIGSGGVALGNATIDGQLKVFTFANGTSTILNTPGLEDNRAGHSAISNNGAYVAGITATNSDNATVPAFLYSNGNSISVSPPDSTSESVPTGVNTSGEVVGIYSVNADQKGFIYNSQTNTYYAYADPSSSTNLLLGVNDSGSAVGDVINDSNGNSQGVVVSATGPGTVIDVPGAKSTYAESINNLGEVAGTYTDAQGNNNVFVYNPADGSYSTINVNGEDAYINDSGEVVGTYVPSGSNVSQGFIATPRTVSNLDSNSQEVERLYYALLERAADPAGLSADDQFLVNHPAQIRKVANGLIQSQEYHSLHGHQSNAQFVEALYEAALGRSADPQALAMDTHALAHGMTRQALAVNVAESAEAIGHLGSKPA